jgi:DNA polymerase-3 subunit beta
MKFTITREKLQEGLLAVGPSIPTKTTLPVLSNILIEVRKDGLHLSGTDLDIAVSTTVAADVDEEGRSPFRRRSSRRSPGNSRRRRCT